MSKIEFEPDLIVSVGHPLSRYVTIYLDEAKLLRCFEARIQWGSFVEPTFGEVIIGATRDGREDVYALMYKPRLGEFDYGGVWARLACGKVLIELDETGKKILDTIVRPYEEHK